SCTNRTREYNCAYRDNFLSIPGIPINTTAIRFRSQISLIASSPFTFNRSASSTSSNGGLSSAVSPRTALIAFPICSTLQYNSITSLATREAEQVTAGEMHAQQLQRDRESLVWERAVQAIGPALSEAQ